MAQYIPPHTRSVNSPDKSNTIHVLGDIFEQRANLDLQVVTIRRSSVINGAGVGNKASDKDTDTKSPTEPPTVSDLNNEMTAIIPQLLSVLKSIDSRLETQGATLGKLTICQNVMQKSINFGHANSSELKDRIVTLEKEKKKLLSQNDKLKCQGGDMATRLNNIDQQLAQLDHNNRRRNIVIDQVQESAGENTLDIALDILSVIDTSLSRGDIDFTQRVFTPGIKTKPILVALKSVA